MYMLIWGKFVLYKYVTCWLVTVSRENESHLDKLGGGEAGRMRVSRTLTVFPLRKECASCQAWALMALKKMGL